MLLRQLAAVATALLFGSNAIAQETGDALGDERAEIALSNDTLELRYVGSGGLIGVEDTHLSGAFFLSEERDIVLSAALLFPVNLQLGRLEIAAGPQIYAALLDEENDDVLAMSVGAELRYEVIRRIGFAIAGHAYYAPDVLTFGSADNLTDLSARAEFRVAPRMLVFGGMRWFEFDLADGGGERTLQEEIFVGFGYRL